MAEERLIDTDKDKKYRIKINADGEEELIVSGGAEEDPAEIEEVMFAAPDAFGEEAYSEGLTPEQLEEKRAREEAEAAERKRKTDELLEKAKNDILLYRYATALEFLDGAEELDGENGEIQALKLQAYTRNFTDYSQIVSAAESADKLAEYTSPETKAKCLNVAAPLLEEEIAKSRAAVSSMNKQNEENKAERAVRFERDRNITLFIFCALLAVVITFTALSAYYSTLIHSVPTNRYLIITCVFAGLAVLFVLALAVAARFFIGACRRVGLNKRNTTTRLGRELLVEQNRLKALIAVYSALKGEK